MPTRCFHCNHRLRHGHFQCDNPKCRQWNFEAPKASREQLNQSTVLLSDASLTMTQRIETGLVDEVFGGGIATTSVNLLGGEPGAGKTTLCLMLANIVCEQYKQKEALYIANEQHANELKDTASRLELRNAGRIRIVKAMGGVDFDIGDLLLEFQPCIIFLDSVTKWTGEDPELAVKICQRLKDYTVRLQAPSIVVNQVTKDGGHAGLNKMQHAVDMTCLFDILIEDGVPITPETPRRLSTLKNRFGPAPVEQFYQMTAKGLKEIELSDEE